MDNTTLQQRAYRYIQKKILRGDLAQGSRISESSLASRIGISRTPVREAISQLLHEGYVERVPRFGTIVRAPDRDEIGELFEVREALEGYAAGLAAKQIDEDCLRRLTGFCDEMLHTRELLHESGMEYLDTELMRRYRAADMGFHMVLLQAAGNQRIMKLVADSHVMSRLFWALPLVEDMGALTRTHGAHRRVLETVQRSDVEQAQAAMVDHIRTSKRVALEQWDQMQTRTRNAPVVPLNLPEELVDELSLIEQEFTGNRR